MNRITDIEQTYCPFWDCRNQNCQVAFSREPVGVQRCLYYCLSDDHDNCPLYLGEALRRSRTRSSHSETQQFIEV